MAKPATEPEATEISSSGAATRRGRLRLAAVGALVLALAGAALALAARRWGGDPEQIWEQARADATAGRFDAAERGLARLARLRAPTAEDWMVRAQVAIGRKRIDEAVADFNKVPDGHPLAPEARFRAGQVQLRRDHAREAAEAYRAAIRLKPDLRPARYELIYIYGMQLRRPELDAQFRALAALGPLDYDQMFLWCLTRVTYWKPDEVVDVLGRYVEADPSDRDSRLGLVENLLRMNLLDRAASALAPLPHADADARALRARLALARGDLDAAEALLAEGPADHPGLAGLRGKLALLRRDAAAADRQFRIALRADPDDHEALTGLAAALKLAGRPGEAEPYLAQVKRLDQLEALVQKAGSTDGRADPDTPRRLAAACEAAGLFPQAVAWLQMVIARDPLDRDAQRALFRLRARADRAKAG